jgi:hypothetical protein
VLSKKNIVLGAWSMKEIKTNKDAKAFDIQSREVEAEWIKAQELPFSKGMIPKTKNKDFVEEFKAKFREFRGIKKEAEPQPKISTVTILHAINMVEEGDYHCFTQWEKSNNRKIYWNGKLT